eukprot:gene591-3905_t
MTKGTGTNLIRHCKFKVFWKVDIKTRYEVNSSQSKLRARVKTTTGNDVAQQTKITSVPRVNEQCTCSTPPPPPPPALTRP